MCLGYKKKSYNKLITPLIRWATLTYTQKRFVPHKSFKTGLWKTTNLFYGLKNLENVSSWLFLFVYTQVCNEPYYPTEKSPPPLFNITQIAIN